jgi:hypothetical protein
MSRIVIVISARISLDFFPLACGVEDLCVRSTERMSDPVWSARLEDASRRSETDSTTRSSPDDHFFQSNAWRVY